MQIEYVPFATTDMKYGMEYAVWLTVGYLGPTISLAVLVREVTS